MNISACLLLLYSTSSGLDQGRPPTASTGLLPVVVVTPDAPTDLDRYIVTVKSEAEVASLTDGDEYRVHRFETFQLVYRRNTLGLEDAAKRTALMAELAGVMKEGTRIFDLSQLS